MSQDTTTRQDVYTRVTNRIIADLEQGVRPWLKPWNSDHAAGRIALPLRHNGTPYRGVNILLLWGDAADKGFSGNLWMTFKQAQDLGGHVRKGEHGSLVVYADRFTKAETDEDTGEEVEREIPFMKGYTVFNTEQVEGLPEHYYVKPEPKGEPLKLIEQAETFFANTGAVFLHGGDRAFYATGPDVIRLPHPEAFRDAEAYAATKGHELVHWVGNKKRLNRNFSGRFGDEAYTAEELVAELGAAFLAADLGIAVEPREDHAAYIASWLKALKGDRRFVFSAAAHAQRALDYLHQLQGSRQAGGEGQKEAA